MRSKKPTIKQREYNQYLGSREWQEKRFAVLQRDGYRCTACKSKSRLEVHHLVYSKIRGEEALSQLTTLCHVCHLKQHGMSDKADREEWREQKRQTAIDAGLKSTGQYQRTKIKQLNGVDHDAWLRKMEREIAAMERAKPIPQPEPQPKPHEALYKPRRELTMADKTIRKGKRVTEFKTRHKPISGKETIEPIKVYKGPAEIL